MYDNLIQFLHFAEKETSPEQQPSCLRTKLVAELGCGSPESQDRICFWVGGRIFFFPASGGGQRLSFAPSGISVNDELLTPGSVIVGWGLLQEGQQRSPILIFILV